MQNEGISERYVDGTYAESNPEFGDDSASWKVAETMEALKRWKIPHQRIAEVGCGGGAVIAGLAQEVKPELAVGYEPMPEAYAVAKSRTTESLSFRNETVTGDTRADYDLVLCFDVFEHVEDCFTFIRNLTGLSSRILFHIPLDMSVQMVARMKPIIGVRESVGHLHYFSKETALATLSECGLNIEGCFYTFGGDAGSHGGLMYNLMKLPRKLAYRVSKDLTVRFLGGFSLMVYTTVNQGTSDAGS
ncbi:MAG: methyltransferase domain-containing protein [Verrucomicrobiota bacterium]